MTPKYFSIFGYPCSVLKILKFSNKLLDRGNHSSIGKYNGLQLTFKQIFYRGFDDLELNKNIQDSLVGYDRNRTPAVKNTRENSLEFVIKYNNQRKVNEIMACLYQGQKTQTDHFFFPKP